MQYVRPKKWVGLPLANPPWLLQAGDVRGLQALGARGHFKFNRLAFVQLLISIRLNRGKMDENIFAGLALDESEALACIEPLHCSLFFHCIPFLCLFELFGAFPTASRHKKIARKCGLAGLQEV